VKTRYGWESLQTVLAEPNAAEMIRAYARELSPLRDAMPLDPDWDRLRQLEAGGIYRIWAARADDTLAGFISFFVQTHHNYRSTLLAIDAGHFVSPAFRATPGRIGYRMWKSSEAALRDLGVKVIVAHDNSIHPLMPLMLALDYEPRGTLFYKAL
jgi:hypothetical protein